MGRSLQESANSLEPFNLTLKDPGIFRSDDWEFPADSLATNASLTLSRQYLFPNAGILGQVHRGTPWQTIYLKPTWYEYNVYNDLARNVRLNLGTNEFYTKVAWSNWYGIYASFPIEDRKLVNLFTAAPNENAARGLLSVNQTNLAAWSAIMSGTYALSAAPFPGSPHTGETIIEPGSPQLINVVSNINYVRSLKALYPHGVFTNLGSIFAAPALTTASPWLNQLSLGSAPIEFRDRLRDEMIERIPQQILGLLKVDEPRFVTYSFGQALKPAPRSLSTEANFYNICTNYQVAGEVVTKTVFRVEGSAEDSRFPLRTIVESFQVLPPPAE